MIRSRGIAGAVNHAYPDASRDLDRAKVAHP
jgi:hypothetical protein